MDTPTADDVRAFLGVSESVPTAAVEARLTAMGLAVRTYVRGQGFVDGEPNEELASVIVSATARDVANPGYVVASQDGPFQRTYARNTGAWTLHELAVLNHWRTRAA